MRKTICAAAVAMACLLTGCGSGVPDLSRENTDVAAQYIADALLQKDKNYDEGLDYDHSLLQPTPAPTSKPTKAPGRAKDEKNTGSKGSNGKNTGAEPAASLKQVSISSVYGMKGISVTPTSYKLKDSYGSSAYQVMPHRGKRLVVVYFNIANKTNSEKRVNFMKGGVSSDLLVNGSSVGAPLITFADNDMQNLDVKLGGKKKKQGVLLFEVAKSAKVGSVEVRFRADGKEAQCPVR